MIGCDVSAVLGLLLNSRNAFKIAKKFFAAGETLHAPHLLDVEVAQVLRRYLLSGQIETARGLEALDDLADLSLQRYPHDLFLPRIWELRHNLTAYDAVYIALVEALAAKLVTCDHKLAASVGHNAQIELI